MLKNILLIGIRNFWKNKAHALINLVGLSLGITSCLVIFTIIRHQTSYDTHHAKADRIYRVVNQSVHSNGTDHNAGTPLPLTPTVRQTLTGIEKAVFIGRIGGGLISIGDTLSPNYFDQRAGIAWTEPEFFEVFDRGILMGNGEKLLTEPFQAVISERWATSFFGSPEKALGQTFRLGNGKEPYQIVGVMDNYSDHTHFNFDLFLSLQTRQSDLKEANWESVWSDEQCYLLLYPQTDTVAIHAQLAGIVDKHFPKDQVQRTYFLQPLAELHFDSRFSNYLYSSMSWGEVYAMAIVGLFLLLTSCINFVNLATALAIRRSREVGIRKVMGSGKGLLMWQILGETALITLPALLVSLGLAELCVLKIKQFLDLPLLFSFQDPVLLGFLVALWVVLTLASGLYPAFVMAGYSPVSALKNSIRAKSTKGYALRQALIGVQFLITQVFLMATGIVYWQMKHFHEIELGFQKEALLQVDFPTSDAAKTKLFKNELLKVAGVQQVTLQSAPPQSGSVSATVVQLLGKPDEWITEIKRVDHDYVPLYGIDLLMGENLPESDTANAALINEAMVRYLGFNRPEEAIGQVLKYDRWSIPIVGVTKNFHTRSLQQEIKPLVLMSGARSYYGAALKINLAATDEVREQIRLIWKELYPGYQVETQFYEEEVAEFYEGEEKMATLLAVFSFIALFIGALGLYGLISYLTEIKAKEIGVRKVLGASIPQLLLLLSRDYTRLLLVAFALAAPLVWWAMGAWLENYVYRIALTPWLFLPSLVLSVLVAWGTSWWRSWQAASVNPVEVLRAE